MTQPNPEAEPAPIIAEIYPSRRLLKWRWRFRFISANGEKLGDDYNNRNDAVATVTKIVAAGTPVVLHLRHRDGIVTSLGRIR